MGQVHGQVRGGGARGGVDAGAGAAAPAHSSLWRAARCRARGAGEGTGGVAADGHATRGFVRGPQNLALGEDAAGKQIKAPLKGVTAVLENPKVAPAPPDLTHT